MTIPKQFYYNIKRSEMRYSQGPPGDFNPARALRGKKAFASPIFYSEYVPKTLVLADWSAAEWSWIKIDKVIRRLQTLMEKPEDASAPPFDVYAWQSGILKKLTSKTLSQCLRDSSFRENMFPDDLSVVSETAI